MRFTKCQQDSDCPSTSPYCSAKNNCVKTKPHKSVEKDFLPLRSGKNRLRKSSDIPKVVSKRKSSRLKKTNSPAALPEPPKETRIISKAQNLSINEDDMNRVLYMIQKGEGKLDICAFMVDPTIKYLLKKHSASDTNIFFKKVILPDLQKTSSTITLKSWIDWNTVSYSSIPKTLPTEIMDSVKSKVSDKRKYEGLAYEARMYQYVTENIVLKGLSNNFVPLIAFGTCPLTKIAKDIQKSTLNTEEKLVLTKKFARPAQYFPQLQLNVMVTGTISNREKLPALGDFLDDNVILMQEVNSIIVQLLHALYVMQKLEVMQNDLHFGNILLEILSEPKIVTLSVDDKTIKFQTKFIPKIFDWDRGYCPALGDNPIMYHSERYLQLNSYNRFKKSADYYQAICELFGSRNNISNIKTILKSILPEKTFTSWRTDSSNHKDNDVSLLMRDYDLTKIVDYIEAHESQAEFYNNVYYIDIPKEDFEKIIWNKQLLTVKMSKDQVVRYNMTDKVYVGFDTKTDNLYVYGGWYCMPYYTVSEKLLYPLEKLFNDPTLFANLTEHLKLVA